MVFLDFAVFEADDDLERFDLLIDRVAEKEVVFAQVRYTLAGEFIFDKVCNVDKRIFRAVGGKDDFPVKDVVGVQAQRDAGDFFGVPVLADVKAVDNRGGADAGSNRRDMVDDVRVRVVHSANLLVAQVRTVAVHPGD